jgi:hypothetical protein
MAKEVILYNKIDRISNAGQIGHKLLISNEKKRCGFDGRF